MEEVTVGVQVVVYAFGAPSIIGYIYLDCNQLTGSSWDLICSFLLVGIAFGRELCFQNVSLTVLMVGLTIIPKKKRKKNDEQLLLSQITGLNCIVFGSIHIPSLILPFSSKRKIS